ncbi:MAG: alpha/beta fold hydrolase, partial [Gemmatimonadales bacterium]
MAQLRAPDGATLAYDAYEPARARAAILWLCGWSDHRTRWRAVGERLRDAGYAAYLLDQRGHGDSGGARGHLSRFSQLLGDLQAFRRLVRLKNAAPQVLLGHSFGGLVVLRYLETQPSDPVAAAVLSSPWLATAARVPLAKRVLAKLLADLWPSVRIGTGLPSAHLCHDQAVTAAYDADPAVHHGMTPGAWREIQWAQRVIPTDAHRLECPLLFLLAGADRIADAAPARALADSLRVEVQVRWYPELYHEILLEREAAEAVNDVLDFLAKRG